MVRWGRFACGRTTIVALAALALVAAVVAPVRRAEAYPIPPVTLWELVQKADTIVLATVETERPVDGGAAHDLNRTVAALSVAETWKGSPGKRLDVPYPAGLLCPAPPRYEAGLSVLAFLTHDMNGRYETVGLSYGTLYPEPREVPHFRRLVQLALAAQAQGDAGAREKARIDWLVQAASIPATRWHGLYALAPEGDALHAYYDGRARGKATLTSEQLDTLARAFVASPDLDVSMPMMLKVLSRHASAKVDETAVAAVDTLLDLKHPPLWTAELVSLTLERLGKGSMKAVGRPPKGSLESDPLLGGLSFDVSKLRSRWAVVRKTQSFPRRTLDLPSNSGVPRVGATTPP